VDSYADFINSKTEKNNDNLQESSDTKTHNSPDKCNERLKNSISLICKYQKPFIKKSLDNLLENSIENIENIEII
jgi:hypothetical protein